MNYYRRFPGDYTRDTRHLTLEQHGAYTLLLDHAYSTEVPIVSLESAMKVCAAMTKRERLAVKFALEHFFDFTVDGYINSRVKKEIRYTESISSVRRQAAISKHKKHANAEQVQSNCPAIPDSRLQTPEPKTTKTTSKSNTYARTWPVDLILLTGMREHALINGVDNPELEFEHWRDDCQAHGRKYVNWMAAWRNRIANYEKFNGGTGNAESFDQGKRRRSGGAIGEVASGAGGLVQKMDRCLPDARSNQTADDGLRGGTRRFVS